MKMKIKNHIIYVKISLSEFFNEAKLRLQMFEKYIGVGIQKFCGGSQVYNIGALEFARDYATDD